MQATEAMSEAEPPTTEPQPPEPIDLASVALPPRDVEAAPPVDLVDLAAVSLPTTPPEPLAPRTPQEDVNTAAASPPPATPAPTPQATRGGPLALLARAWTGACGAVGLLACLAVLAAVPVLQLMTLGWLLEAEGRLGRTGSLRGALPGVERAARIGSALLGVLVVSVPWLVLRSYAADAHLLDPTSKAAQGLASWTLVVGVATAVHAAIAIARGGRFVFFFRPIAGWLWAAWLYWRG